MKKFNVTRFLFGHEDTYALMLPENTQFVPMGKNTLMFILEDTLENRKSILSNAISRRVVEIGKYIVGYVDVLFAKEREQFDIVPLEDWWKTWKDVILNYACVYQAPTNDIPDSIERILPDMEYGMLRKVRVGFGDSDGVHISYTEDPFKTIFQFPAKYNLYKYVPVDDVREVWNIQLNKLSDLLKI